MSSFHFSILLRERPPFWKKQRKQKSNSLSFSSPVLFTVKLEWNLPAFLCEEGLCTSSASKSTCDTSPQCDDYCGSVTVCQEFGCTWKLLLFLFFPLSWGCKCSKNEWERKAGVFPFPPEKSDSNPSNGAAWFPCSPLAQQYMWKQGAITEAFILGTQSIPRLETSICSTHHPYVVELLSPVFRTVPQFIIQEYHQLFLGGLWVFWMCESSWTTLRGFRRAGSQLEQGCECKHILNVV